MVFFSQKEDERKKIEKQINALIEQEGQVVLGWRTVPVNVGKIGTVAQKSCPFVRQVFIGASSDLKDKFIF